GFVKTRLVPPLTMEEAANLYCFFLKDIFTSIESLDSVDLDYCAAVVPLDDGDGLLLLESIIPEGVDSFTQVGATLGDRLYDAFERLFDAGYKRVAVIGSDSPDLDPELIAKGFTLLKENAGKVVIGPAMDGGYYLIAMDRLDKRAFEDISWSTSLVLDETLERLNGSAILLPRWYDIDRPADIARLDGSTVASLSSTYLKECAIFKRCRDYLLKILEERFEEG
ncbi:MAG: TIGR04282 family arsenosugar biosynthesis glycosyltransferase, partial [Thermodesulfobacteriota bacterium]